MIGRATGKSPPPPGGTYGNLRALTGFFALLALFSCATIDDSDYYRVRKVEVIFEPGSWKITDIPAMEKALKGIEKSTSPVQIEGYYCEGDREIKDDLSYLTGLGSKRARRVREIFEEMGIDPIRLHAVSLGASWDHCKASVTW